MFGGFIFSYILDRTCLAFISVVKHFLISGSETVHFCI